MLPLLVRITDTSSGEVQHLAFSSSPVRIGRNQLNEFVLAYPFISQWHAVVRFDEHRVRYIDLGSTNGTTMNGRRVAKHMQVVLQPDTVLFIGPIQLSFTRGQVNPNLLSQPRNSIFQVEQAAPSTQAGATMMFDPATMGALPSAQPSAAAQLNPSSQAVGPSAPMVNVQDVVRAVQQIQGYHQEYRRSWGALVAQIRAQLQPASPALRESMVQHLCQQFPQLAKEDDFRNLVQELGITNAAFGDVDVSAWISRLSSGGNPNPGGPQINTGMAMERIGAVLESFSQSFVELRKGYEQFGEEMALNLVQEQSPVLRAQNGHQVLTHLLDWNSDGNERIRELTRAFADLAMHQVALLSGIMEGTRSLLDGIAPTTLSGTKERALAKRGGGGFLNKILPFGAAKLWHSYSDKHGALVDEDRFSRELFGRRFAKAYYTVTGGKMDGETSQMQQTLDTGHQTGPYNIPHN